MAEPSSCTGGLRSKTCRIDAIMRKAESRAKCLPGQILVTTLADMRQSTTGHVPASKPKLELAWIAHIGIELAIL